MRTGGGFDNSIAEMVGKGGGLVRFELASMAEFDQLQRHADATNQTARAARLALRRYLAGGGWLTSYQVARELDIPVRLVRELAAHGTTPVSRVNGHFLVFGLPAIRFGNEFRFPRPAIEQILGRPITPAQ